MMKSKQTEKDLPEWIEAGIFIKPKYFSYQLTQGIIRTLANGTISGPSWHYFFEPNCEIRFRVKAQKRDREVFLKGMRDLRKQKYIYAVVIREYKGEEGLYGQYGFKIASDYFKHGGIQASELINQGLNGKLEKSLDFHAMRRTHLFLNQLGYSTWKELRWALKYAYYRFKVWLKYRPVRPRNEG